MKRKGYESTGYWSHYVTFSFDLDLGFSRSDYSFFLNSCIPGMRWSIDLEGKGFWSIGSRTHFVTSKFDLTHNIHL